MSSKNRWYLLLSFMLHLVLSLALYYVPVPPISDDPRITIEKKTPLEVQLLESTKNQQQIVRQTQVPKNFLDKKSQEKARFFSASTERVLLETKAKLSGQTANRVTLPKYQQELFLKNNVLSDSLDKVSKDLAAKDFDTDSEVFISDKKSGQKELSEYKPLEITPQQRYGVSTLGEALPNDISVGDFTALNTDRFQFYTFYSRVEELVRYRWESKVRESIEFFDRHRVLKNLSQKEWVSQIEFLIDSQGHLRKAIILKESGIEKFDLSAVFSFEDAKVFPNPPKEMLKADGFIHLRYSFHVYFNPSYTAK